MKKKTIIGAAILAVIQINTYGDMVLSDTPQVVVENYQSTPASTSMIVGRNGTFWDLQWGTGFRTGSEQSQLHSALFLYNGAWYDTTGGFRFALHADNNGLPGEMTAQLQGPERPVNGITWYTAESPLLLEANTVYWLVASAPQTESPRFFEWRGTTSGDEIAHLSGWELLDSGALRTDEGAWASHHAIGHTAIQVQAVPEPVTSGFIFSVLGLVFVRRLLFAAA